MNMPADPKPPSNPGTPPAQPDPQQARRFRWVPVRSLAPRHRERILAHLIALDDNDRHLRFGYAASDDRIADYVAQLDFDRDEVFGIFNRKLELVAMAHLACHSLGHSAPVKHMAEFAVSVRGHARGRGYGARLFDHAAMHARNRGIEILFIHALSENTAMLRIARSAGATIERDGSESEAYLKLAPDDLGSRIEQVIETGAAELNYQIKHHARRLGGFIDAVGEVRERIGKSRQESQ
jgi:GNAT superfamily N-acetyltransferase